MSKKMKRKMLKKSKANKLKTDRGKVFTFLGILVICFGLVLGTSLTGLFAPTQAKSYEVQKVPTKDGGTALVRFEDGEATAVSTHNSEQKEDMKLWGSTKISDSHIGVDWVALPDDGNITFGNDADLEIWYNSTSNTLEHTGRWGSISTDEVIFGNTKEIYNTQKDRRETWIKGQSGDEVWVLYDVTPGRVWEDRFVSSGGFYPSLLGYSSEIQWSVNGVMGGADPDAGNFVPANELGGGLIMKALSGNADDDYTALHWGGNYPTTINKSPHLKITAKFSNTDNVAYRGGLGGNTRASSTNAFTSQDNFIGLTYDTDIDNNMYFKIVTDGTEKVNLNLGAIPTGHSSAIFRVNDDGDAVTLIFNGSIVNTYEVDLPTVQLQPYAMVMTRDATDGDKELHLHDFRLIMDRGAS